ncbi:MAG: sulfatase-like hydrolase/transferase [Propionibacteriaceae bacterium]|jgi:phosphoglycerol transferase|nr:sulfatase-like hydrolase/transferase [Propionibacteriaceae bacterium]
MVKHHSPPKKKRSTRLLRVASWALSGLALFMLAGAGWIRYRFGEVSLEQIVMNLPGAEGGEGAGNEGLVVEAAFVCIGLPLVCLLFTAIVLLVRRKLIRRKPLEPSEPAARPVRRRWKVAVPAAAFVLALAILSLVAGVPQHVARLIDNRTFAEYYVRPQAAAPQSPKNLITIYLESMENTFGDKDIFGQNLLAELDEATAGWNQYGNVGEGLRQYQGGGWTMAGIVGTQCGIPLKSRLLLAGVNPNDLGEQVDSYLPGAECLGDILAENGYTNAFIGGAQTRFAGKDTFLKGHGYQSVKGLGYWEANGADAADISIWGLSDVQLFEYARKSATELRDAGTPFNLTILTLDTHEPAGVYPSCVTGDQIPMATAIKCSMRAVSGFLEYLRGQGFYEDTVIVVMGDHLKATSEGGDFKNELDSIPDRAIVYRVWSPDPVAFSRSNADQLSVFPTTLDLLGFGLEDGRAGLGISFVGDYDLANTALRLPEQEYRELLDSPSSELYREFWKAEV